MSARPILISVTEHITDMARQVMGILLPQECVVCSLEDWSLCPSCQSLLRRTATTTFRVEGGAEALPWLPGHAFERILPVYTAARYKGPIAAALLAFKDHGDAASTRLFASIAARTLTSAATNMAAHPGHHAPILIVPIPGTLSARLKRGFSPLDLITSRVRRRSLLPAHLTVVHALRTSFLFELRHVFRASQKRAGSRKRHTQTRGKFRMRRGVRIPLDAQLVIFDDVLTTGATIAEATRVLVAAGYRPRAAVVLASTRSPREVATEASTEVAPEANSSLPPVFQEKSAPT